MLDSTPIRHDPWNKGKLVGQKAPFKLKEICEVLRYRDEDIVCVTARRRNACSTSP